MIFIRAAILLSLLSVIVPTLLFGIAAFAAYKIYMAKR